MTKSAQMSELQWARLAEDANYGVRRGAWYRVAELTSSDAVVDVNRKQVALPRGSVKLRTAPPKAWSIVPRPRDARRLPETRSEERRVGKESRARRSRNHVKKKEKHTTKGGASSNAGTLSMTGFT